MGTPTVLDFEGTNGSALDTAQFGGTLNGSTTGSQSVYDTSWHAGPGGSCGKFTPAASTTRSARKQHAVSAATMVYDFPFKLPATRPPNGTIWTIGIMRRNGGVIGQIQWSTPAGGGNSRISLVTGSTDILTNNAVVDMAPGLEIRVAVRFVVDTTTAANGEITWAYVTDMAGTMFSGGFAGTAGSPSFSTATANARNLGTGLPYEVDAGALTAGMPAVQVDYVRTEDARTTPIGAFPTATASTIALATVTAAQQYPEVPIGPPGVTIQVTFAGSTAVGTPGYGLTCTEKPDNAASPSISQSTTDPQVWNVTLLYPGVHVLHGVVSGAGAAAAGDLTIWAGPTSNGNAEIYSVGATLYSAEGGKTAKAGLNDTDAATRSVSPPGTDATQKFPMRYQPIGVGPFKIALFPVIVAGTVVAGARLLAEDGTTVIETFSTWTPDGQEKVLTPSSGTITALTGANDLATKVLRRALVVEGWGVAS